MLLRELKSIEKTGSGYILHGDAADVLLIFMTDDVIRVRVSSGILPAPVSPQAR